MKRLIIDLDGTLTMDAEGVDYPDQPPRKDVIDQLAAYRKNGFSIVIFSARNMRTYSGSIGLINVHTLPVIIAWLEKHCVPYDEVIVGKPWCGTEGFYVDDRCVRPSEFARFTHEEIVALLKAERADISPPAPECDRADIAQ